MLMVSLCRRKTDHAHCEGVSFIRYPVCTNLLKARCGGTSSILCRINSPRAASSTELVALFPLRRAEPPSRTAGERERCGGALRERERRPSLPPFAELRIVRAPSAPILRCSQPPESGAFVPIFSHGKEFFSRLETFGAQLCAQQASPRDCLSLNVPVSPSTRSQTVSLLGLGSIFAYALLAFRAPCPPS